MTKLPIYIFFIYVKIVSSSKFETVDIGTTEFGSKFDKIPSRFNFLDSVIKLKIQNINVHIIGTHYASSKSVDLVQSVIEEIKPRYSAFEKFGPATKFLKISIF